MRVYLSNQNVIWLSDQPFASGGEGAVYKVETDTESLKDTCVKIYHDGKKDEYREKRIKYMVENPPEKIRGEGFLLGWPLDWVTDESGQFIGFVMPMGFAGSKELTTLSSITLSNKLDEEWRSRYDRQLGKTAFINRLKLISNIALPVHILHSTGKYVIKDFKPQNVLATADGRVTICDMDSIQIVEDGQLLFPGTAATPDYIPSEFYTRGVGSHADDIISPSWDSFALGVVFYQLLFGLHPYTVTPKESRGGGSNTISQNIFYELFPFGVNGDKVKVRPKPHAQFMELPEQMQNLFLRTFNEDASNRPTAEEWGRYVYGLVISTPPVPPSTSPTPPKETGTIPSQNNDCSTPPADPSSPQNSNKTIWWVLGAIAACIVLLVILGNIGNKEPDSYYPVDAESVDEVVDAEAAEAVSVDEAAEAVDEAADAVERELASPEDQEDEESIDDGKYVVDGIVYAYEDPSRNDIDEWRDEYAWRCSQLIEGKNGNFNIPEKMLEKHPCLVYLILDSKSLEEGDEKQKWFDMYNMMNDDQIYKLYDILYREKYKLAAIEAKYQKKQKEIRKKYENI